MQINPPFGYKKIVPLYKNNKVKLPEPGSIASLRWPATTIL
jgi:hypothetical protein